MTAADLAEVVAIQETIVQGPVGETWRADLAGQIGRDSSRCLVAVEAGRVAAFLTSEVTNGAFGLDRAGWIAYVGVNPRLMGQGIGRALAQALFELFEREGVREVYTAVKWDSVDMLSFFKSLGFDRSHFINLHKRLG
jgi:ribosomal protein S18 acetylase RimI-like enzyme